MISKKTRETPCDSKEKCDLFASAENLLRRREIHAALAHYEAAEAAGYDPDACAGARWICHMLLGDFETAWRESDAIERRGKPDPNRFWNGQPLTGKRVLIRCLHGLGDTLQYVRYAPYVRNIARSLAIEAQPALKSLLAQAGIADQVITWGDPEPLWDQQIEIVELPRIFRTTVDTIPAGIPYLQIDSRCERNGLRPRIGLLWQSSDYNPARSIPFSLLSQICRVPGAQFLSFQPDPGRADLVCGSVDVQDFFAPGGCILETARRLQSLDLLITADSMLTHLAGALGVTTWTLLPFEADWRWMLDRSDSPWYPAMRLFRQPSPGDWQPVVEQVSAELHASNAQSAGSLLS